MPVLKEWTVNALRARYLRPEVSLLVRLEGRESFLPRSEPKDRIKIAVPRGTVILMRYFVIKIEGKLGKNDVIKPNRMG